MKCFTEKGSLKQKSEVIDTQAVWILEGLSTHGKRRASPKGLTREERGGKYGWCCETSEGKRKVFREPK